MFAYRPLESSKVLSGNLSRRDFCHSIDLTSSLLLLSLIPLTSDTPSFTINAYLFCTSGCTSYFQCICLLVLVIGDKELNYLLLILYKLNWLYKNFKCKNKSAKLISMDVSYPEIYHKFAKPPGATYFLRLWV